MKAEIAWTEKRDIEASECGEFCGENCQRTICGLCSVDIEHPVRRIEQKGKYLRTDFCKRNEVKAEKHLEPICQGCRAYDAGFCLNLHESIETDVIICEHFMGWDADD